MQSARRCTWSPPLSESAAESPAKIKPWIKIEDFDDEVRLDNLIFPFPFIEPGTILNAFELVSGSVESLGEETVRGVSTDHYRRHASTLHA